MRYHTKNGTLQMQDAQMDYIRFGSGGRNLVILPGLGDSLRTVKGTALPMAWMYRMFAKDFTVYAFSRKAPLQDGWTTRDMARDQTKAMEKLGIQNADVFGVSMGGMIAQYLAIDYPQKVGKLILAVTSSCPNPILTESVSEWIGFAQKGDHSGFMDSNLRRIYSKGYYRKYKWLAPVIGRLTKPKSYQRFYVQANACVTHDAVALLNRIQAPTLVMGGAQDMALGADASREIALRIPNAQLRMYEQWGHGVYEEAEDFNREMLDFLLA